MAIRNSRGSTASVFPLDARREIEHDAVQRDSNELRKMSAYSKLSVNEQNAAVDELTQIVRSTE